MLERLFPMALVRSPKLANQTLLSCNSVRAVYLVEWSTHGSRPIPLTFHTPSARHPSRIITYTTLTIINFDLISSLVLSYFAKAWFKPRMPLIGFMNSIYTIIMLNIWRLLPDMYIMMAFIGICFAGARATSQAFFNFSVSVSSGVGGLRALAFDVVDF